MVKKIGILALQGNFQKHKSLLEKLGLESNYVRYASDLDDVNGLIIPGGESTTMTKLLDYSGLFKPIISFAEKNPVLGTCAGLIMMANNANDDRVNTFTSSPWLKILGALINVTLIFFWIFWYATEMFSACLLYTSPSPRDQRGSRMPSSA